MGFSTFRSPGLAYSERNRAAPSPNGIAVSSAIAVVQIVAVMSGMTPNDASAKRGAQRVPKRNSIGFTSAKNLSEGMSSAITMPTVTATVMAAATRKTIFTTASPGRFAEADNATRGLVGE
jgi:hypothetical protein